MNKLNLDVLHKVPEIIEKYGTYPKRFGKTFYCLYTILGHIQVLENETIVVLIQDLKDIENYYSLLNKLFEENDLKPIYNKPFLRIGFKNNSNQIKFMSLLTLQMNHPTDFVSPNSFNQYLIMDLNNLPPFIYEEGITISEAEKLNDYKKYLII